MWPFSKKRKLADLSARLKIECERICGLDLPWRIGFPDGVGLYNIRPLHGEIGYSIDITWNNGTMHKGAYAPDAARAALAASPDAYLLEYQGPITLSDPALRVLVLATNRVFRPPPATSAWLPACGVVDPFSLPEGGETASSAVTAG